MKTFFLTPQSYVTIDLIIAYPSGLKAVTNERNTPLHYAAMQGVESVMQLLIRKNPKAVQQRNIDGEWPIDLAIKHRVDPKVLEVFEISAYASKNTKKSKASTPRAGDLS
jgi:ankyrin repeat protein